MDWKKLNWKIALFLAIISVAVFLRIYNFSDWMLFKGDSFRDAVLVSRAYENGPGELPLLGPRAGGSILRLGPIFYYFEYASSLIFRGTTPAALAFPNLLFSILTIPVFYLLARKYFNQDYAMLVTGAFSLSFLAIEYSRFAWNPNSTPFFTLFFFYALLNIFDPENSRQGNIWAGAAGLSLAISSQMHFTNFLGLPIILFFFLAFNWKDLAKYLSWQKIAIFLGAIIFLYLPVIISDVLKNGDNVHQFLKTVGNRSSDSSLFSNIKAETFFFGKYFSRIITGYIGSNGYIFQIGKIFILFSTVINVFLWQKEKDRVAKNFLLIWLLALFVYFFLYMPLAKEIDRPRFFLPLLMLPFFYFGFWGRLFGDKKWKLIGYIAVILLAGISMWSNFNKTFAWLSEINSAQNNVITQKNARTLKAKKGDTWWTWDHFMKTAEFINADCPSGNIYFTVSGDTTDYEHSFEYALKQFGREIPSVGIFDKKVPFDQNGCYYFISQYAKDLPKRLWSFSPLELKELGNVNVLRFKFNETADSASIKMPKINAEKDADLEQLESEDEVNLGGHNRLYWKDIFTVIKKRLSS